MEFSTLFSIVRLSTLVRQKTEERAAYVRVVASPCPADRVFAFFVRLSAFLATSQLIVRIYPEMSPLKDSPAIRISDSWSSLPVRV
jgi:hypothetical protein